MNNGRRYNSELIKESKWKSEKVCFPTQVGVPSFWNLVWWLKFLHLVKRLASFPALPPHDVEKLLFVVVVWGESGEPENEARKKQGDPGKRLPLEARPW